MDTHITEDPYRVDANIMEGLYHVNTNIVEEPYPGFEDRRSTHWGAWVGSGINASCPI